MIKLLENNKFGYNINDKYYLKDKDKENEFNENYYNQYNYNKKNNESNRKITKIYYKIEEIVDYLNKNDLCPAVIFVFSIKRINEYAKMLSFNNLIPKRQKNKITNFFNEVISTMSEEDRKIPQVMELKEILQKGIGIHHSGLLPILKEAIEVLYSRGLIKILFATTSFSIGLNMPTRTVVFTDLYKYNDYGKEILSSSEYLQMCGRAGRRGIDSIGNIFILLSELSNDNEKEDVIGMLKGKGDDVVSKFRLCYRTLLSFFSRNIKDMNRFFRESFLESNMTQKILEKNDEIESLKSQQKKLSIMKCPYELEYIENKNKKSKNNDDLNNNEINNINIINNNNSKKKEITIEDFPIAEYYKNLNKFKKLSKKIFEHPKIYDKLNKYPGIILKVRKKMHKSISKKRENKIFGIIDDGIYVILIHAYNEDNYFGSLWCLKNSGCVDQNNDISKTSDLFARKGTYGKYKFSYKEYKTEDVIDAYENPFNIFNIKSEKKNNENILKKDKNDYYYIIDKQTMKNCLKELADLNSKKHKLEINFESINLKDLVKDIDFRQKVDERHKILEESKNNYCLTCKNFDEHYKQYQEYEEVSSKINKIMGELKPENRTYYTEFKTRLKTLQDLNYVNEDNTLTLKGKAAREIVTTDCVLITELLTSDILISLKDDDDDIIGFISGFASNKSEIEMNDPNISKKFSDAIKNSKKFMKIYMN